MNRTWGLQMTGMHQNQQFFFPPFPDFFDICQGVTKKKGADMDYILSFMFITCMYTVKNG